MNSGKTRMLVVDDELGMRLSCRKVLEAEGYEIETASDGREGYDLFLKRGDFAGALVDMKMPGIGGIELVELMRKKDEDLLILVITAYATIETAVEATKRGAYGYIPKPFTPDELLLPVRNGLERRALAIEARQLRLERERQMLELAFERSRARTILACMTDGVVVVNRERRVVLMNPSAAAILAGAGAECALPMDESLSPELSSLAGEMLAPAAAPLVVGREITVKGRPFLVNASPVQEPGSDRLGAVLVLRDITELKRLESAKSLFVSMVAHEIKSPLAAIEGYLELALDETSDRNSEDCRGILDRAMTRAATLRSMLDELMSLRAMETGNFALNCAVVDLRDAIKKAMAPAQEKAARKNIEMKFEFDGPERAVPVLADSSAMLEVVGNLLDNAVKYTGAGGQVLATLGRSKNCAILQVRDSGVGIPPEHRERIFDEFYRIRCKATASIAGTGLGLAIVKRLVEMHRGRISVASEPGKGSEFTVLIPLAADGQA